MSAAKVVRGPWVERVDPGPQLDRVAEEICSQLAAVTTACDEAEEVRELFVSNEKIRPVDCSRSVVALQALRAPISTLCILMSDKARLPMVVARRRYQLLVPLQYANEQASKVIPLVLLFRSVCLQPSPQSNLHQQTISYKLDQLLQSSRQVTVQGQVLLDQMLFAQQYDYVGDQYCSIDGVHGSEEADDTEYTSEQ